MGSSFVDTRTKSHYTGAESPALGGSCFPFLPARSDSLARPQLLNRVSALSYGADMTADVKEW
jgi:hypothetical protein